MYTNKKKDILIPTFSVFALSVFPIIFLYTQNVGETSANEMLYPLIIFIGIAIILSFIFYLFVRDTNKTALIVNIFMLLFLNYVLIEKVVKLFMPLKYWHIAPILIVVFLHFAYLIYKKMNVEIAKIFNMVTTIAFCALILLNFLIAMPTIIEKTKLVDNKTKIDTKFAEKKLYPNVYYIILDEYSSFNSIKKYYVYDNSGFAQTLENEGFNVSLGSHNESIDTITITTNIVNLNYVVTDNMIQAKRLSYGQNPEMFRLFSNHGYEIVNMSSLITWNGVVGGAKNKVNARYGDFTKILLENTMFYPFLGVSDELANRQNVINAFNQLQETNENSDVPVLTYAHIESPHAPFVFDENGKMPDFAGLSDWKDHNYYLNQYKYITKLADETIKHVIKNDPKSIIILQSDHSARWTQDNNSNSIVENIDARNILNAVYYMDERFDEIKDQSGVNTARLVIGKLFNINLPTVEVPNQ